MFVAHGRVHTHFRTCRAVDYVACVRDMNAVGVVLNGEDEKLNIWLLPRRLQKSLQVYASWLRVFIRTRVVGAGRDGGTVGFLPNV